MTVVWIVAALILAACELAGGAFFLVAFALGAAAGAVLAQLGADVLIQAIGFGIGSVVAIIAMHPLRRRQANKPPADVGATRLMNATGRVTADIDNHTIGTVRIGSETWRASSDTGPLTAGSEVIVQGVRGTRVVVTAAPEPTTPATPAEAAEAAEA